MMALWSGTRLWWHRNASKTTHAHKSADAIALSDMALSLDRNAVVNYDYVVVLLSIEVVASTCNLEIRLAVGTEGRVAQSEEHRPYKPEVTGSSPVPPIGLFWGRSSVG